MRKPVSSMEVLTAIVAIAESRNRTKAAAQLGITASALHKRLKFLADALGARVVHISGDHVELTEVGETYYAEAVKALEHATLAEEKARALLLIRANRLLIGHSTYLAPRLLSIIHQLKMDGPPRIHIDHRPGITPDLVDRVANGTLHAAFGFLPVERNGLLIRQLLEEPLVACIPSEFPLALRAEIHPTDLEQERFIAVARHVIPALHAEIDEHFQSFGINLRIVADAFSSTEALAYVEQKIGVSLLATSSAVPRRGVTIRPLASRALTRRSGLFIREDNRDRLIAEFVELVLRSAARFSRRSQ